MIPDNIVQQVRDRADIVELVAEHVPLRRAGKDFKGLCPFHQEKTPSFYVVPSKGFYKCFGCGESGDAFGFLMKRLGLAFQDAVRLVAVRAGVEIPEAPAARRAEEAHRAVYEAVAFAADFYRRQLWDEPEGEPARRYLEKRGIARPAAERFGLGYALDEWRALRQAAHRHGMEDVLLLSAGLIKESDRGEEPYDRFRDRLIFPIADAGGRVIALGGRVLSTSVEGAPKYLNSPETPIYQKGRVLYGLHWAKPAIRREEAALVVEGYMDYVSLASRGIENVVAPLGTSMTEQQAGLLARYAEKALLLYDSDAAGLRATFRSGDALLGAGVHPLVVTLPPGEDPDSLARKGGAEALRPYLDGAVDVLERKLQILERRGYFKDIEGVRRALDGLLPTLRAAADAALRDIYVARVAERTGVRRDTLEKELAAEPPGWTGAGDGTGRGAGAAVLAPPGLAGQHKLLLLLLADEARIPRAAEVLQADEFSDPGYRELFQGLVGLGPPAEPAARATQRLAALPLSEPARARFDHLRGDPEELSDGDRIFQDAVNDIHLEHLYLRLDGLDEKIRLAEARGEDELLDELFREKVALTHTLRGLGYSVERMFRKRRLPRRGGPSTSVG